ncbi:hypothetical protein GCM10017744_103320 [Streptomyces antimycoticus]|uniref:Uncharacterized protein n=1 Tax=Streptomyces antimycoticus TaxID=68175 RepID=A0A4D4KR32_9ACTN|nr:hypothetical protein [Streptomyces antimycoticus]GDY49366.1 hypothetical protein SANT12839_102480 [Streptomyces antimycoticus]
MLRTDGSDNPRALNTDSADTDSGVQGEITVTVELTVTEEVTYEFNAEVAVPTHALGDPEALRDYLDDNEDLWLDELDPTGKNACLCINERSLDKVSVVLAA